MSAPIKLNMTVLHLKKLNIKSIYNSHLQHFVRAYAVGKKGSPNRLEEIEHEDDDEFRVLVIPGHTKVAAKKAERRRIQREIPPPRHKSMPIDQDWTNVWPASQTFKWSSVPFPVKQGLVERSENDGIPPGKYGNAELMKIPNFLHLTPAHIKKHCEILKKYCTKWPEGLNTKEDIVHHFPIEVITKDYVMDAPTPRDDRARTVTIKIPLSALDLDYHARDKFIRLVGDRYDKKTDILTISSDRCPLKKQNYDFCLYALTAVYYESWKIEPWESEKQIADMEKYVWDIMPSKKSTIELLQRVKKSSSAASTPIQNLPNDINEETVADIGPVKEYKEAIETLHNVGEDSHTLEKYKQSVAQLLGLQVAKA